MDSVTEEAVEKLMRQKGEKEAELNALLAMKIETIWLNELTKLKDAYNNIRGDPLNPPPNNKRPIIKKKF